MKKRFKSYYSRLSETGQANLIASMVFGSVCAFSLFVFLIIRYLDKEVGRDIADNMGYAIGRYERRRDDNGFRKRRTYVEISYRTMEGKAISVRYNARYTGYSKGTVGKYYLVIYNIDDPYKGRMLFDYPIRNAGEFDYYLKKFEINPLDVESHF